MLDSLRAKLAVSLLPKSFKTDALHPFNLLSFYQAGQPIYTDMTVKKATREGYRLSVLVYRAIRTIVQAASGIPWIVLDKNGEEIQGHSFTETWSKPNPEFSGQDNMEFIIAHLKLVGNALIQPTMVNGQPREFWICMPDMINPIPSKVKGEWLQGYQVTDVNGGQRIMPPDQFIHFMQFDPGNPYWGIGDLQAAARTVDTDNEAQDTQKLQLQNRSIPPGVFQFKESLTDDQFKEATRQVREKFLQKSKRGEPWVLGGGYTWQQMSITPKEMDYIASRLQNKRDIAAAFGISPIFLGDLEQSSYNNMAEAKRSLYEEVVIPLLDDIRSTLNLRIAPLFGGEIYITYDVSNVSALREDFGKRIDQAQRLWNMGVPFEQINTKLELGFEEFDGWDTGYLPFSVAPVGSNGLTEQPEGEPDQEIQKSIKALNLETEEQKSNHWKRIDRRRESWSQLIQKRVLPLYEDEAIGVISAISGDKSLKFTLGQLNSAAREAIEKLKDNWEKLLTAANMAVIEDLGKEIAQDIGGYNFDSTSAAIREFVKTHAAENVKTILETNLDDVKNIIAKGIDDGLTRVQIGSQLRQFYDDRSTYKALRIARTETAAAAGFGQRESAKQSGVAKKKQWLSSRDDRVRDSHILIDGEIKALDEPYSNGLMFPGDPSGDPAETIMCRCVESYITE